MQLSPRYDMVFLDFDETLFHIKIIDREKRRLPWRDWLKEKFAIESTLTPIFEEITKIGLGNPEAGAYLNGLADQMELDSEVTIYPYTAALLELLKDNTIYIVSSNGLPVIERTLKQWGFDHYISGIICRSNCQNHKPSPAPLEEAWRMHCKKQGGIQPFPSNFLLMGDSWRDMESGFQFSKKYFTSFQFVLAKHIPSFLTQWEQA